MQQLRRRYIFDIVLSVLLIIEMFFELTGDIPHEILGVVFFVTIVAHLILSRKWMSVTAKQVSNGKKLKFANLLRVILAIGLAICFVALAASSMAISLVFFDLTGINLAGDARQMWIIIHTVSSYGMCIFTIAHVLVHWAGMFTVFKIPYNPERRQAINTGASALVAVSAVALGISAVQAVDKINNPSTATASEPSPDRPWSGQNQMPPEGFEGGKRQMKGKHHGEGFGGNAPEGGFSGGNSGSSGGSSGGGSSSGGDSNASGYCTLCKMHCPLSNPQCNRPYQAGLL